jgi:predicted nucleotidyltransferase
MEIEVVKKRTIFLTGVGSRAYGIHRPDSDHDQAGVMIPPAKYFFGLDKFEQFKDFPPEDMAVSSKAQDKVIYDIRKAISLIADNNPNMLDLLFSPERCILILEPEWQIIMDNRELFISKKCRHTYSGYAFAQLRRINTHRKFLIDPPKNKPVRDAFGLPAVSIFPTAQLKAVVYSAMGDFLIEDEKENFLSELDDVYSNYVIPIINRYMKPDLRSLAMEYLQVGVKSQANTLKALGPSYIKDEYLEMATKELQFYSADLEWQQFASWSKSRNKARAELEVKYGYDTKHAAHLVRLIRMCREILETGKINVDRTDIDAEELKEIRDGAWEYDKLEEYAKRLDDEAGELYNTSIIKRSPDTNMIKNLCETVCEDYIRKNR